MKKLLRTISVIGIITLIFTSIINELMPKVGRMAYTIAGTGQYRPLEYQVDFSTINFIAACMVASGIVFTFICYIQSRKK